jgi:hypothetical protein
MALATALVAGAGCSGTDSSTFAPPPDPPGSGDPGMPPGSFGDGADAGGQVTPTACTPADMSGFQPAWTPPQAWKQGVCTSKQTQDFYAACLASPISPSACKSYVEASAANTACAACLQSQETDAAWGAVVWHDQMRFWTVNVAGCLSYVLGDSSPASCAAAYEGAIQCRQKACDACWANTANTFTQFAQCESQAGQTQCVPMDHTLAVKCGDLTAAPASACVPPSGSTTKDAYDLVAVDFCGPKG